MPLDNIPKNPEDARNWLQFFSDYPIVGMVVSSVSTYAITAKGWLPIAGVESCKKENELLRKDVNVLSQKITKFEEDKNKRYQELEAEVKALRNKIK